MGYPRAFDGVVEPHPQSSQGPGYAVDPVAPRQGGELQDGLVYLGADAMCAGDFSEHPGDLGAHRGRAVVDKCAHEGYHCLLAPRGHPRKPGGPVVMQAVPRGIESVPRPVIGDLDRDVVKVAPGVGVVGDEGGDVLCHTP